LEGVIALIVLLNDLACKRSHRLKEAGLCILWQEKLWLNRFLVFSLQLPINQEISILPSQVQDESITTWKELVPL